MEKERTQKISRKSYRKRGVMMKSSSSYDTEREKSIFNWDLPNFLSAGRIELEWILKVLVGRF
jgi:hypothetical protein